jgi:hypothetical protein
LASSTRARSRGGRLLNPRTWPSPRSGLGALGLPGIGRSRARLSVEQSIAHIEASARAILACTYCCTAGLARSWDSSMSQSMASTSHPHQVSAHATGARGPEKRSSALGGPSAAALEVFPVPDCSSVRAGVSYLWSFAVWDPPQVRPEALTTLHLWARAQLVDLHFPALYMRQSSVPSRR